MRDAALRRQKDRLIAPAVVRLFAGVHPNTLSVIAMTVGLLSAYAGLNKAYLAGLLLWALNRLLDGMDGLVARVFDKQTDFGGYLDLMLDFVVYLAIPVALIAADPTVLNLWAGIALLTAYVLNLLSWSTLSALIEKRRSAQDRLTSMEMPAGLIEGAETIVFYTLFFLLPGALAYLFLVMAILVLFTASQRVRWAYRHL